MHQAQFVKQYHARRGSVAWQLERRSLVLQGFFRWEILTSTRSIPVQRTHGEEITGAQKSNLPSLKPSVAITMKKLLRKSLA